MAATGRALKREFLGKVRELPLEALLSFSDTRPAKDLIHGLFSGLCSSQEKVRWFSISVFGRVMARLADKDIEAARVVMRRFMWMLNDESGGIGWGVPEAFAECLTSHEKLAEEYTHILISFMREDGFYLELEPLQRGLMWGIGSAAKKRVSLLIEKGAPVYLPPYLDSADANVRGLASWALGNLRVPLAQEKIQALASDDSSIRFYDQGHFSTVTVGDMAVKALAQIEQVSKEN